MSNTRKARGKRPFRQVGPLNQPIEDIAKALTGKAGVFVLQMEHDDDCPTPQTQRSADCTCTEVDQRLLQFTPPTTEGTS